MDTTKPSDSAHLNSAAFVAIVVALILLVISADLHSPTLDEPGHLAAGCLCVEYGIFDLYEVNPPLIKAVAALPVTYRAPKYDWKAFDTTPGERCEWAVGRHLISANGANSFQLFTIARWSLLSIWCLGGLVVHKWGSACGGNRGGFAALLLWCFSIEVQAWTPTLCADSSFASLIAASAWLFRRWLSTNRQTDAILFGFSLGIMVSAKSSGLVFFILYPALVILQTRQFFGRMTRQTIISLIVAFLIVNAAYGFHRTLRFNNK